MKFGVQGGEGEAGLAYAFNNGLTGYMIGGMIVGFIASLVMMFKQSWAPYLAPVYAAAEGLFLGAVSLVFNTMYDGIVMNAVGITLLIVGGIPMGIQGGTNFLKIHIL